MNATLRPDPAYKDSGVEWLGQVPVHREVRKLEHWVRINERVAPDRKAIELFQQFRTRLIADVVTGKLDVREAAASLPEVAGEPEMLDEPRATEAEETPDEADGVDELGHGMPCPNRQKGSLMKKRSRKTKPASRPVLHEPAAYGGPGGEILLYRAPDGMIHLDVRLDRDTVWLSLAEPQPDGCAL